MEPGSPAEGLRVQLRADSDAAAPPGAADKLDSKRGKTHAQMHAQVAAAQVHDVLSLLLAFRFLNALCMRSFFQPDEYFQALEPAWSIAFGSGSGAWLTWEWQHQLRSSLHPAIFGLAYRAVDGVMSFLHLFPPFRAFILVALPGALQSVFAALGDFYTWKLAMDIYGRESNAPWAALWVTVLNPWQWYCSTRTFSNSLETTLTIAALCYWPWEMLAGAEASQTRPLQQRDSVTSLRISLVFAAVAVLLRPTNLLIWLVVLGFSLARLLLTGGSLLPKSTVWVLVREIGVCGVAVLALSLVSDRLYFGFWTFPPYKWLYFNISQSLAVFYGHMPWHYYLSQGVPLLTTTFLPFTLVGLYKAASSPSYNLSTLQSNILRTLAFTTLVMIATLSLISHKEVRFIYPLLPILHILAAPYISAFFTKPPDATPTPTPTNQPAGSTPSQSSPAILRRKLTLAYLLSLNLLLAGYLSVFHQSAPIAVLSFLRSEFERIHPDALAMHPSASSSASSSSSSWENEKNEEKELFALFLTPCHSTPWRSHLVYPALRARALTCEPPLHTAPGSLERQTYLDEADRFYLLQEGGAALYGVRFLAEEMWPGLVSSSSSSSSQSHIQGWRGEEEEEGEGKGKGKGKGEEIPRYIIGFEGIEPVLEAFFGLEGPAKGMGVRPRKVWSAWNGLFNDDWRRRGRLVVWDTGVYGDSYEATDAERGEGSGRVVDEL
ncbi:glycosyltransferase family 22 protein [Chaetomium strumarium]|uniref:Mannosyltransferase n=1 Tax=Chaetomium strumarium TaxID=1170767 RepID=A0AAJ0LXQ2_9PEZI|nr:glycosyltransferase family 22 protein [Chaetomium strumarium]